MVTKSKVGIKMELSIFYGRITVYLYTSKSIFFKEWFNREGETVMQEERRIAGVMYLRRPKGISFREHM